MATTIFRQRMLVYTITLLLIKDFGVQSLKLLELRVPSHVPLGTRAELYCSWKLGPTDILYSVKWYKNEKEFFRFVPRNIEPIMKFPLPGVDIYASNENASNVTLTPAQLQTGGRYRCEVSGEKPIFRTVTNYSDMHIVVLPEHGPKITGSRIRYRVGDRVQVNCTSGRSKPATGLAWYINGELAPANIVVPPTYEKYAGGLQTTSLGLDFKVKPRHFRNGDLKLKCLATIATVYWRSNEESVQHERLKSYSRSRDPYESSRAHRLHVASKPGGVLTSYLPTLLLPLFVLIQIVLKLL